MSGDNQRAAFEAWWDTKRNGVWSTYVTAFNAYLFGLASQAAPPPAPEVCPASLCGSADVFVRSAHTGERECNICGWKWVAPASGAAPGGAQVVWLIERNWGGKELQYVTETERVTLDPHKALRFSTKAEAEKYILIEAISEGFAPAEHMLNCGPYAAPPAPSAGADDARDADKGMPANASGSGAIDAEGNKPLSPRPNADVASQPSHQSEAERLQRFANSLLQGTIGREWRERGAKLLNEAADALRRLEAAPPSSPPPQPVAWLTRKNGWSMVQTTEPLDTHGWTPLYSAPPAAGEQAAALRRVVLAHCADLESCAAMLLKEWPDLTPTANEMKKAASELRAALTP